MPEDTCSLPGCDNRRIARGWCRRHYDRWRRLGDPLGGGPLPSQPTECLQCGVPVLRQRPSGPSPSYCSRSCKGRAYYHRNRSKIQAKRREIYQPRRYAANCTHCGLQFEAKRKDHRFCSARCREQANPKRCSEQDCDRPVRAKALCATHYNATYHKGSQRKYDDPEKRRVWLRRRTQWRRALTRDPNADLIDRDEIGERDGWRCGICRRKVDNTLAYPHPRSPSLDHIVPLSLGGRHVRENVRIAHLSCNMRRSNNSSGFEQTLLIG